MPPAARQIIADTAHRHRLKVSELLGRCRARAYAWPRHEAMWLIRQLRYPDGSHRYSLPQIAAFFGMDHTSVLHGVRRHEARIGLEVAA